MEIVARAIFIISLIVALKYILPSDTRWWLEILAFVTIFVPGDFLIGRRFARK